MDKHTLLSIMHVMITVPLLFLIYAYRKSLQPWQCKIMLVFSLGLFAYFAHKCYAAWTAEGRERSRLWVYLLHITWFIPLLLFISYKCEKTERKYFEMLLMVAFAGLGYHGFQLIKQAIQTAQATSSRE